MNDIAIAKRCLELAENRKTNNGIYNNDMLSLVPDLLYLAQRVIDISKEVNEYADTMQALQFWGVAVELRKLVHQETTTTQARED